MEHTVSACRDYSVTACRNGRHDAFELVFRSQSEVKLTAAGNSIFSRRGQHGNNAFRRIGERNGTTVYPYLNVFVVIHHKRIPVGITVRFDRIQKVAVRRDDRKGAFVRFLHFQDEVECAADGYNVSSRLTYCH
ncbi:hypothetical protein Barb7_02944 [Bacteroidales bacterium Barb7]|nr:hypothetical protein Barb7_02944 [Bacteroidales bacterium Barb7]